MASGSALWLLPGKRLLALSLHVVLVAALLVTACGGGQTSTTPAPSTAAPQDRTAGALAPGEPQTALPVEADDAVWGRSDAPVTLVTFLDFECPFCARGFQTLQVLKEEYGPERLRIVVKHLPLEFHPAALPAAIAAQAVRDAAGNDAFFAYAERLMNGQRALDAASLADHAEHVGLERSVYNEHVGEESTFRAVVHDMQLAQRLGITGTPAFYVNGAMLQGAQPPESFRELIDAELTAMRARLEQGADFATAYAERVKRNLHASIGEQLLARDPTTYRALVDGSPVLGEADALVTLVEFSDFECPFCKRARPTIAALKKKYGSKLRVVFKHLPLDFHRRAEPASRLADAVYRERGNAAFWQAVDRVFASSPDLSDEALTRIGKDLGLTSAQIQAALRDDASSDRLERDAQLAADLEANGTPHFFVNGRRITGAQPPAHFEIFIDAALREAEQALAAGTPREAFYDRLMARATAPGAAQAVDATLLAELGKLKRPSRGPAEAPLTVHVFSDFECPFCRDVEHTLQELDRKYPKKLRFVWHHLPLPFHEHARLAARAAEEAFVQGGSPAFWKMHAALFNLEGDAPALTRAQLDQHARSIGLDPARFKQALDRAAHEDAIGADEEAAAGLGIRGTPAFLVGSYLVKGAQPLEVFDRAIVRHFEERLGR